jgi:hypothetical protein
VTDTGKHFKLVHCTYCVAQEQPMVCVSVCVPETDVLQCTEGHTTHWSLTCFSSAHRNPFGIWWDRSGFVECECLNKSSKLRTLEPNAGQHLCFYSIRCSHFDSICLRRFVNGRCLAVIFGRQTRCSERIRLSVRNVSASPIGNSSKTYMGISNEWWKRKWTRELQCSWLSSIR